VAHRQSQLINKKPLTQQTRHLCSINATAEMLDVKHKFVRRLVAERKLAAVSVGRLKKIPIESIEAYIERHTTPELA
jgi:excisionase family DNA binding protein